MTQTCLASTGIRWHAACAQDGPEPLPRCSAAQRLDQGAHPACSRLGGPGLRGPDAGSTVTLIPLALANARRFR
eukprot:2269387-Pyramimonas_sp.AAC.1